MVRGIEDCVFGCDLKVLSLTCLERQENIMSLYLLLRCMSLDVLSPLLAQSEMHNVGWFSWVSLGYVICRWSQISFFLRLIPYVLDFIIAVLICCSLCSFHWANYLAWIPHRRPTQMILLLFDVEMIVQEFIDIFFDFFILHHLLKPLRVPFFYLLPYDNLWC